MAAAAADATRRPRRDAGTRTGTGASPGARVWLWSTVGLTVGAAIAAVALAPPADAPAGRSLTWLLFIGSSVHVASTGWLFGLADVRRIAAARRSRFVVVPGFIFLASALTAAALTPAQLTWVLVPYFGWQFFHFQKQNLGWRHSPRPRRRSPG